MNVFVSHTPSNSVLLKLHNQRAGRRTACFSNWVVSKRFQMSRKTSKRVSFSPDLNDKQPVIFIKQVVGMDAAESRNRVSGLRILRLTKDTKFLPVRFLWRLKSKVEKAMTIVSMRRESSRRVSASSFKRSKSVSDSMDSHRAEAIEDCIEFFNSSSSLSRSNSVSGSSSY